MTASATRVTLVALAVLGMLFLAPQWLGQPDAAPQDGTLTYLLAWEWGKATPLAGGGWSVTTDLGYRVRVERGYVTTYWTQLTDCDPDTSLGDELRSLVVPGTALAGHGDDANDTRSQVALVEDLSAPGDALTLAELTVKSASYCGAHYLLGPAPESVAGLDPDGNSAATMPGTTLHVEGTYTPPGSDDPVPFTLTSTMAYGILLETGDQPLDVGGDAVTVKLVRQLDSLFDGVDFEADAPDDQSRAVLKELTHHTTALVSP